MLTQRQLFLQHLAQTSDLPLMIEVEKAEGSWITDTAGKRYLDLISGISVSSIGHRHPRVVEAIREQTDRYLHVMVYGEFIQSPQVQFAQFLTQHLPDSLNCVYFTNSGTEATEGAMKLVKRATGRSEIISFRNAYHGSTQGALSLAGGREFQRNYRPLLPGTRQLDFGYFDQLNQITEETAAVFAETVQGEAGAKPPPEGWLQKLRQRCDAVGALLVLDEIQAGMGRTGSLWAFEQEEVVPDVLLLGKAFGGGMPLAAFIASQELMGVLKENPVLGHITTFGGHPVSCAAARAAFQVLTEEKLTQQVKAKEERFRQGLQHPNISGISGRGLLLAVQLDSFHHVQQVIRHCFASGIITDWFLFNDSSIRLAPPLTVTEEEIDWACEVIREGVERIE